MVEPEVGKCYRYKTNKYYIGKFVEKKMYDIPQTSEGSHRRTGTTYEVLYNFTKQKGLDKETFDRLIEECPCEEEGGRRTRKTRKNRNRKSRKVRKF